jgi:hypothetical protein
VCVCVYSIQYPAWQSLIANATPVQLDMLAVCIEARLHELKSSAAPDRRFSVISLSYELNTHTLSHQSCCYSIGLTLCNDGISTATSKIRLRA